MAHFTSLSESQIQNLESHLLSFHEHKAPFLKYCGAKLGFNGIPKLHMPFHYFAAIRLFGTPDGFSTEAPERFHIDYAKDAYRASNRVNYFFQMSKWLARQDSIRLWTAYMNWACPEPILSSESEPDDSGSDDEDEDLPRDEPQTPTASPSSKYPIDVDTTHPRPSLALAIRAPLPKRQTIWIHQTLGLDIDRFLLSVNTFLADALPPRVRYLKISRTDRFDFWTRARLIHPANALPTLDSPETEVLAARPPKMSSTGRIVSPGIFSTALLLTKPEASGIQRYRAVRLRAIFTLPDKLRVYVPEHLVLVEFYSTFSATAPSSKLKQYTVSPSKHANGSRKIAVVPLKRIKLACHLTPHFHRMLDEDWDTEDLVGSFSHLHLNDFSSHVMYGYMREWNAI